MAKFSQQALLYLLTDDQSNAFFFFLFVRMSVSMFNDIPLDIKKKKKTNLVNKLVDCMIIPFKVKRGWIESTLSVSLDMCQHLPLVLGRMLDGFCVGGFCAGSLIMSTYPGNGAWVSGWHPFSSSKSLLHTGDRRQAFRGRPEQADSTARVRINHKAWEPGNKQPSVKA